jgi:hypothetical protein
MAAARYAWMPSSVIQSFDYEAAHSRLTVTFTTGRVYEYYMVPAAIAAGFKEALSKGTFFNKRIRDKYACREIAKAS